jgi:GxxExxY protein
MTDSPENGFERREAETPSDFLHKDLTQQIIGAAIEVHKHLGPGLLESAYEECLCHELALRRIAFARQVDLPVMYKGVKLDCGYRMDLVIQNTVVVELKCVEKILPVHEAQIFTYLRLAEMPVGLLFNFYTDVLTRGGVVRKVLSKPSKLRASAPLR